jgi:galactokinase
MSDLPSIVPAIITPLTKTEQIKAVMAEFNLKYNAARCRIDPEFHERVKECKRVYEAWKYRECPEYRQQVMQRVEKHLQKQAQEHPEAEEQRKEWYREYSRRPEVKARRAAQRKSRADTKNIV